MNRLLIYALLLACLSGCSEKQSSEGGMSEAMEVNFSSSIDATRATSDGMWEAGDRIGITTDGFNHDYINISYEVKDAGASSALTPQYSSEVILYPAVESDKVTFNLYYPYDVSAGEDNTISLDVTQQEGVDLYSKYDFMQQSITCEYGYSKSEPAPSVDVCLEHKMARVVIHLTFLENIEFSEWEYLLLRQFHTKASYSIESGERVGNLEQPGDIYPYYSSESSKSCTIELFLHPHSASADSYLAMGMRDYLGVMRYYKINFGYTSESLEAGYTYTYEIGVGNDIVTLSDNFPINSWAEKEDLGEFSDDDSDPMLDLIKVD